MFFRSPAAVGVLQRERLPCFSTTHKVLSSSFGLRGRLPRNQQRVSDENIQKKPYLVQVALNLERKNTIGALVSIFPMVRADDCQAHKVT